MLPIAHRGGGREAPENTLAAFRRAVALGCPMLELDVRATADREVVVLHDAEVGTTTDGEGPVAELTLDEVRALDAAHWFVPGVGADRERRADAHPHRGAMRGEVPRPPGVSAEDLRVPTLREVLEAFPRTWLTVEVKATAPEVEPYEDEVARTLIDAERDGDVIVGSFSARVLDRFAVHAPRICTSTSSDEVLALWRAAHEDAPAPVGLQRCAVQVPPRWEGTEIVTERFVEAAHRSGLAVHVWTVDDRREMRRVVAAGADGLMSDRPHVLVEVLDELGVRYPPR